MLHPAPSSWSQKPSLAYLGPSDEPRSEPIIVDDTDSRLMTIEGHVALTIQQAKYSHGAVLITHSDVDVIRWGAEEGHLVFLALQDQDLDKQTAAGWKLETEGPPAVATIVKKISPSRLSGRPRWRRVHRQPQRRNAPSPRLGGSHMRCWLLGCRWLQTLRWRRNAGTAWSTPWPAVNCEDESCFTGTLERSLMSFLWGKTLWYSNRWCVPGQIAIRDNLCLVFFFSTC